MIGDLPKILEGGVQHFGGGLIGVFLTVYFKRFRAIVISDRDFRRFLGVISAGFLGRISPQLWGLSHNCERL